MAGEFNTGITGPKIAPGVVSAPAVFQEGAVSGRQLDWTLQENTLFRALATSVGPAISKWKALDVEAQKLKADKVDFEYRTTLDEYNAFVETTTNKELWSRLVGTAPVSGRRRTWLPGFDDNENTPVIPGGAEEVAAKAAAAAPTAAPAPTAARPPNIPDTWEQSEDGIWAHPNSLKTTGSQDITDMDRSIWEAEDSRLQSQYDPKDTEAIKKKYGKPKKYVRGSNGKFNTGDYNEMKEKEALIKRIREEEKQKQIDAGYDKMRATGETRRYIEANWALFGDNSFQTSDALINSWRTP
jgi:hypothetical protein